MVKIKAAAPKRPQQQQKKKKVPKARVPSTIMVPGGLDRPAKDYAKLLADPCNGPLVHGVSGDASNGVITRFETDLIINATATETCAFLAFAPGINTVYVPATLVVADSTFFNPLGATTTAPGSSFLTNNVGEFRCLSACIQVYWPGSEQNRQGVISSGQFEIGQISGGNMNTAIVRSASQYVERVPDTYTEIVWRPNLQDCNWNAVANPDGNTTAVRDKHTALVVTASGIPVNTGIRVRLVTVIEWKPNYTSVGLVAPVNTGITSRNTLPQVLETLDATGNWMYRTASGIGRAASSLYSGMAAMGRVGYGVAKMAALMA